MSGKDTSSFSRKRTRRQTTDLLKYALENENEDCKRFPYFLRKFSDEVCVPFLLKINNYLVKENGQVVQIDQPFDSPTDHPQDDLPKPVINGYFDVDLQLKKVVCKSPTIDTRTLLALNKTLLNFTNVFSLRLDYCDLTAEHIKLLGENLMLKENIQELSLKGNPNDDQNFYLLINCGLKILNLKFCGIDKNGLEKIADEFLNCSPDSTLIHLNLSSNRIFDEGCKHVAKILRCDRTLQSLNLADCKIRDDGFQDIVKSFMKFSLDDQELIVRRKLRFQYFKLLQKEKDGSTNTKNMFAARDQNKDIFISVEEKMRKHPFTSDCTQENGEVFCKGNYKLESLNISYNRLRKPSFDLISKCLMEQISVFGLDKGLNRVIFDGNPDVRKDEDVRNALEDLLLSRKARKSISGSIKSRGSNKKRKSSAASSVSTSVDIKDKENVSLAT